MRDHLIPIDSDPSGVRLDDQIEGLRHVAIKRAGKNLLLLKQRSVWRHYQGIAVLTHVNHASLISEPILEVIQDPHRLEPQKANPDLTQNLEF
jgi:hypothetical protein